MQIENCGFHEKYVKELLELFKCGFSELLFCERKVRMPVTFEQAVFSIQLVSLINPVFLLNGSNSW